MRDGKGREAVGRSAVRDGFGADQREENMNVGCEKRGERQRLRACDGSNNVGEDVDVPKEGEARMGRGLDELVHAYACSRRNS